MNDLCNEDRPIVKIFMIHNKYFLYDTYSNYLFNITRKHYLEIAKLLSMGMQEYKKREKSTKEYRDIEMLLNKGLLKENFVEQIEHPETVFVEDLLQRSINDMSLQVTRSCNFNCRYCLYTNEHGFERNHEDRNMTWDVAKSGIDFLYEHSCDSELIRISFYGGEPLLNFNLISKVVCYANSIFFSKKVEYSITINGSLLSDEIIDFFIKNNFMVAISFDGPEKIQNLHRKFGHSGTGTFDVVFNNIKTIRSKNREYFESNVSFIAVLFDDEDEQEVLRFFRQSDISTKKVLLQKAGLGGIDYILSYNNSELQKNNIGQVSGSLMQMFQAIYANKSKIPLKWHHGGPCVPAVKRLFVDVDGVLYPCEKIVEHKCLAIGSLANGFETEKIKQMLNIGKISEKECKRCWAFRFCDICVANCNDISQERISSDQKKLACDNVRKKTLQSMKQYIESKYFVNGY